MLTYVNAYTRLECVLFHPTGKAKKKLQLLSAAETFDECSKAQN